jgi:hypothetical protein
MVNNPILARFPSLAHLVQPKRPNLQDTFHVPSKLPAFVLGKLLRSQFNPQLGEGCRTPYCFQCRLPPKTQ